MVAGFGPRRRPSSLALAGGAGNRHRFQRHQRRHTDALKRKHGLDNLEVHQLAVTEVGKLGATFDQIVCTGVLHHLPDPDAGLRALREVLAPGGVMHLMLYAPYGRIGVYMLQEFCRRLGIAADDHGIRELVTALGALPSGHPLATLLREAPDFGTRRRWPMRCCTRRTAPTRCRSCSRSWNAAGCASAGG